MIIQDLFILFFLGLLGWIWWIDRGVKQAAFQMAKHHCENHGVQLLDDNVRQIYIKLIRDSKGTLRLYRQFQFEFTSTGERRHQGRLEMMGGKKTHIELDAFQLH